jgi:integrase
MSETDTAGAAIRAKRLKHLPVKLHHFLERREEGFQAVMLGVQMFTVRQGRPLLIAPQIFRAVARTRKVWGNGISQNVVWYVVRACCERAGLEHIAPHDLRRTCAKLCHASGGELEQIQFLLGHGSVQTTETLSELQTKSRTSGERSV